MRRWLTPFVRVWIWLFVPSLCLWLLVVRWGDGGVDRFASIWGWFENLLAFPLVFRPATTPSWDALHDGRAVAATIGFVVLVAVWATMFALPVALLSAWLQLLTNRRTAEPTGRATVDDFGASVTPSLAPAGTSSGAPPLILIVTLPLALLYQGALALGRIRVGRLVRAFAPALIVFLLTVIITVIILWIMYAIAANSETRSFAGTYHNLAANFWFGYLETLQVPRLFEDQFWNAYGSREVRDRHGLRWIADPNLQTMALVIAVRTAVIPTIPFAIWGVVRLVRSRPEVSTK